ncbi:MAG TPA: ATP synthase F1 subunit gamma [Patescibacteria group bacterium]|uniref:ATP synthase gamma chain n=1 Tax=Candidatus Woesebacteria bacterium RIFCSPHIGHO2_01_FULL_41_10 TaxID=1802500 RepID=A0A1F7YNT5_9BACT|nr:MAG: ATP synthase F1 subunit gamma [Candidatus Woesebacteria bacterium RIFCSPHIGHO2_01_FULL_41_10]HLD01441.1 ATP synthase F1 subunit gamma [Patescibacteria group bacterium]
MAGNRELKRRIRSAGSISKITRAMEAVSGSKMLRAQERSHKGEQYQQLLVSMIEHIKQNSTSFATHPLLSAPNPDAPALTIAISSDRGLAGAFNTNLFRLLEENLSSHTLIITIGKKISHYARKTNWEMIATIDSLSDYPEYSDIRPASDVAIEEYLGGRASSISVAYQKHVNTIQSIPTIQQILPIPESEVVASAAETKKSTVFEPSAEVLLEELLSYSVAVSLYQVVLSSKAAEQSARMVAMKNASKNAKGLSKGLQRVYNREYQKRVTSEISDVITAKMALQ